MNGEELLTALKGKMGNRVNFLGCRSLDGFPLVLAVGRRCGRVLY